MDQFGSRNIGGHRARQDHVLDRINDWRYLTPTVMAWTENRDRIIADLALSRTLSQIDHLAQRRPLMASMRHRFGACLIRIGTSLCNASTTPARQVSTSL